MRAFCFLFFLFFFFSCTGWTTKTMHVNAAAVDKITRVILVGNAHYLEKTLKSNNQNYIHFDNDSERDFIQIQLKSAISRYNRAYTHEPLSRLGTYSAGPFRNEDTEVTGLKWRVTMPMGLMNRLNRSWFAFSRLKKETRYRSFSENDCFLKLHCRVAEAMFMLVLKKDKNNPGKSRMDEDLAKKLATTGFEYGNNLAAVFYSAGYAGSVTFVIYDHGGQAYVRADNKPISITMDALYKRAENIAFTDFCLNKPPGNYLVLGVEIELYAALYNRDGKEIGFIPALTQTMPLFADRALNLKNYLSACKYLTESAMKYFFEKSSQATIN